MQDAIIQGNGNSRYLKSVADFKSLYPTYDDFVTALVAGTLPVDFNGINPAGFRQLGTELNMETLLKDSTAALYGLSRTKVSADLSTAAEGDIIRLPEGGKAVEFYVAKRDYEPDLNGAGRVLVVRKDSHSQQIWNGSGVNTYADSDIDTWFNGDYKALLPADIQAAMGETTFYYTPGNGDTTVTTLQRTVFALSVTELGLSSSFANVEGAALPTTELLKIAQFNGRASNQWSRSPRMDVTNSACFVSNIGGVGATNLLDRVPARPTFTLPSDFQYSFYANEETGEIFDDGEPVPDDVLHRLVDNETLYETRLGIGFKNVTLPTGQQWMSIAYGAGKYVLLPNGDTALYSEDGERWYTTTLPVASVYHSVTYGGDKFIAVSRAAFLYSYDGIEWVSIGLPFSGEWQKVIYAAGKFVAVSSTGGTGIVFSEDGLTWRGGTGDVSRYYYDVAYGNGRFVVLHGTNNMITTSEDGETWTQHNGPFNIASNNLFAFGAGKFVAILNGAVFASVDGLNWFNPSSASAGALVFGDGKFISLGNNRGAFYSEDGVTWKSFLHAMNASGIYTATYGGGKFVVVWANGNGNIAEVSVDGMRKNYYALDNRLNQLAADISNLSSRISALGG